VVRAFTSGTEGFWFETVCGEDLSKTPSVLPEVNRYPTLFKDGEGHVSEEKE